MKHENQRSPMAQFLHDISSPIATITLTIGLLESKVEQHPEVKSAFENEIVRLKKSVDRITDIVKKAKQSEAA